MRRGARTLLRRRKRLHAWLHFILTFSRIVRPRCCIGTADENAAKFPAPCGPAGAIDEVFVIQRAVSTTGEDFHEVPSPAHDARIGVQDAAKIDLEGPTGAWFVKSVFQRAVGASIENADVISIP
jgi:hypothetical protein